MDRDGRRMPGLLLTITLLAASCSSGGTLDELTAAVTSTSTTPTDTAADQDSGNDSGGSNLDNLTPPTAPDPTPLPIDDDNRIGALDNGLTYLLRSNDSPGGSVDLRLLVNAGSAQQRVGDDGSAHFLEHMLFNGTERFPGNDLTLELQRLGISFGPDLNAFTSYDETVYLLTATTLDPTAIDTAFQVLAEWASAATIDPSEVEAEIGVVRDELRQGRESVDGIIFTEFERIYTEGTPYEGRVTIGDPDKVEATEAEVLRAYYDDWYRPDNMAVVVVGDLPLDTLEALVEENFADLDGRVKNPPKRDVVEIEVSAEPKTAIVTHPDNAFDNLSLDLPLPVWDRSTVGGSRLALMETAIALMVTNRLGEAFLRGDLMLDEAPSLRPFSINRGLHYYGANLKAPDLGVALEQFMAELLGVAEAGFSDDDVARMQAQMIASFDDELAGLDSTQDREFADNLMTYWLEGGDIDDPGRRIARQRGIVESLTIAELSEHWRWIMQISGPIVVAIGADASTLPTARELLDIVEGAQPARTAVGAAEIDELMTRPEPAEPVTSDRRRTTSGEIYEWTFDNGVTVSFQHSEIDSGAFQIWTESSGGWSTLPAGSIGANSAVPGIAIDAVAGSGLGGFDTATVTRFLESRAAGISAFINETEEGFVGGAAADDAEVLFQLLHLLVTEPQIDDVGFRTAISQAERRIALAETNVDFRASEALAALLTDGDSRFASAPTQEQLDRLTADELLTIHLSRLGAVDDMHVAIVGDLDVDLVEGLVASYLGTLPSQPADTWVDLGLDPPTGVLTAEVVLSEGTADGGLLLVHDGPASFTAEEDAASAVLQTIINARITDTIREELGASYRGFSIIGRERSPLPVLTSYIQIDGDPTRLDEIRAALLAALLDLATAGPSADEFNRAISVTETDWNFVNNAVFLSTNLAATRFPDGDHLTPDNRLDILDRMTRPDVRAVALALYGDGDRVEVAKVLP